MEATFTNLPINRALHMANRMAERTGSPHGLNMVASWTGEITLVVTGQPQDVMFFIGEVAAHGEDGLVSVTR